MAHKRKVNLEKGSRLLCEICGVVLMVEKVCDFIDYGNINCCGEPMKLIKRRNSISRTRVVTKPAVKIKFNHKSEKKSLAKQNKFSEYTLI